MEANAMVLTHFNALLEPREFEIVPLKPGEVLVKLQSSGICGSDVHMWKGNDPRTPVPIILGHEGVGVIAEIGVQKYDVHGEILKPGDAVVFDRGLTCGECYFCKAKHKPYLCPSRKTYGISIGCSTPPYLNGCYAEYIHLDSRIKVVKLNGEYDPDVLVSATCSGATIAHSFDMCRLEPGDTVVIQGPGATGIYSTAFAKEAG
ncbi:MAG: alcohol dehydrogenase catalytic domain-containing protein, partial [Elusimicrobiota bacterium]